jgi:hypothetical protein
MEEISVECCLISVYYFSSYLYEKILNIILKYEKQIFKKMCMLAKFYITLIYNLYYLLIIIKISPNEFRSHYKDTYCERREYI